MAITYFGNNNTGAYDYGYGSYSIRNAGIVWTCPGTGKQSVKELHGYCMHANTYSVRLAIYDTSFGFLMQTDEIVCDGTLQWWGGTTFYDQSKTLISNPQIDGGTNYILVLSFKAGADANPRYTAGSAGDARYFSGDYSTGFPATIGSEAGNTSMVWCIRCGVEPAAGGGVASYQLDAWLKDSFVIEAP